MDDLVGTVAVFLLPVTPLAAVFTGYVVLRRHRRSGGSLPTWRGVGVAIGLLLVVPVVFLLVGRSAGSSLAYSLLYFGPVALLGIGVYLLAGGRHPSVFQWGNAKKP